MTWCKEPSYYLDSPWKGRYATEGGSCLINQTLHTLDLIIYLGGAVATVGASMHNHSLQGIIAAPPTLSQKLPGWYHKIYPAFR